MPYISPSSRTTSLEGSEECETTSGRAREHISPWTQATWSFATLARSLVEPATSVSATTSEVAPEDKTQIDFEDSIETGIKRGVGIDSSDNVVVDSRPEVITALHFAGQIEGLERVTRESHPDPAVDFPMLTIRQLSAPHCFEAIVGNRHYPDHWKAFRFRDLPPELRNRVYGYWISNWVKGTEVILKEHGQHLPRKRDSIAPCWMPALSQTSSQLRQETFPIFLQHITIVAHTITDLEWLHAILKACKGANGNKAPNDNGYRFIRSLHLPHFFAHPGPLNYRRDLELQLLDLCKNMTTLTIGMSTEILTRAITDHFDQFIRLRELKSLEKVLNTYGIPHILYCPHIKRVTLECVDDPEVYRNSMDDPLRVAVSIGWWLLEGFRLTHRDNVVVAVRVRGGRFSDEGEEMPGDVCALDDPYRFWDPVVKVAKTHLIYMDGEWERRSRLRIKDPWSAALGVDKDVQLPGQAYEI